MIYIYDILLNFSDAILYEFYEWNTSDHIDNMKRIKLAKISKKDFDLFLNYKIKIDSDFLLKIFKTCEVYLNKGIEVLDYCVLFSDGVRVLAMEFNKNGISECKSKLLLDEEEEIASLATNLEFTEIKFELIKEDVMNRFLTRKEIKMRKYLINEIKDSYRNKNLNKLKFLYTEYFDDNESNPEVMVNSLIDSMTNDLDDKHINLYNLLCLSHKKKQV